MNLIVDDTGLVRCPRSIHRARWPDIARIFWLMSDGRIQPARIEEVVERGKGFATNWSRKGRGDRELGAHGERRLIKLMGRLRSAPDKARTRGASGDRLPGGMIAAD